MRRHQRFLALLLVCVYAAMSTIGIAFVICVEGDGSYSAEIIGATCCASVGPVALSGSGEETNSADPDGPGGECESCLTHLPAWDVDAPRIDGERGGATTTPVPLPPATCALTDSSSWFDCSAHAGPAPPPRPPLRIAHQRSAVLRC